MLVKRKFIKTINDLTHEWIKIEFSHLKKQYSIL